jgi:FlaA1/EpsC-like NDP-sugar epimerase
MRSATVRFGNVLGSNGSVVPIFQSQIAAGGPVTITDPEIRRFFMMIPEAVSLVLQTSTMSDGAEVFVLNMGEPIRILDLAMNMIRLAGLEPYEDIDIQITGLRPGEKLTEELCAHDEMVRPTFHEKITVFRQPKQDPARVDTWVRQAAALVAEGRKTELVAHLRELVPEYTPDPRLVSKIRPHIAATVGGSSRLRTTA